MLTNSKGGRHRNLTPNDDSRKDQREFAEDLEVYTKNLKKLAKNPPDTLHGAGRYLWTYLYPEIEKMNNLKMVDKSTFETYCEQFSIYREAVDDVNKNGISTKLYKTVYDPVTGEKTVDFVGYKKNPAVTIISDATRNLKSLASELGFTPQSRAAILNMNKDDDPEEEQSLSDLLNKGDS